MTQSAPVTPHLNKRKLPHMQELGLIIVILVLSVFLTIAGHYYPGQYHNGFLNLDNLINGVGGNMSVYAIMAMGMTCVIVTGGIDISVGAIFGFSALAGAAVLQLLPPDYSGWLVLPIAFAIPAVVGALWGVVNGALTVSLRIHPFIVTLATLSIIGGLTVLSFPSTVPTGLRQLPESFVKVMSFDFGVKIDTLPNAAGRVQHIPIQFVPVIIMLVVGIFGAIFLHTLVAGRETYAIGGNPEAARFSGIRVWWATLRVYIIMGLCSGIAAVVHLGRWNSTSTDDGKGYELMVIASAVVGGASLLGGRGTALGAILGTLVIQLIRNGIDIMHWRPEYTTVIVGISILIAVSVDRFAGYLARRRGTAG